MDLKETNSDKMGTKEGDRKQSGHVSMLLLLGRTWRRHSAEQSP